MVSVQTAAERIENMKTIAMVYILALTCLSPADASCEPWKQTIDIGLNLTQGAYSDNWVGGELASIAWMLNSSAIFEKKIDSIFESRSTVRLSFGQQHNKDRDSNEWKAPLKVNDLIDAESVFTMKLGWFIDPFASARMESQFLDQSDADNERMINPVRLTESVGIARKIIERGKLQWQLRLGGALRQYIDRNRYDPSIGDFSTRRTNDGGVQFVSDFSTSIGDTTRMFSSRLYLYKALYSAAADEFAGLPNEDYWKAPDVNWENVLSASIAKNIGFILYVQWLYDKEVDLAGRFKETLGIGLTYKFM